MKRRDYTGWVFVIMLAVVVFTGVICYYQGGQDAKATPCPSVTR